MSAIGLIPGTIIVQLTSAEPDAALREIIAAGIAIEQLRWTGDLTCSFRMIRQNLPQLKIICQKRGEDIRILKQTGIFLLFKQMRQRKFLIAGITVLLMLILLLPTRILIIRVEGNQSVSQKRILAAAEACGIHFGAARQEVRSERVKNALLFSVPELEWAGVNTRGCVAVITVREGESLAVQQQPPRISSIVAAEDGYILSGIITQGQGLFQVGNTVRKGDVLISGYTDHGRSITATRAEGEIYAQTNRSFQAVKLHQKLIRTTEQDTKRKISLLLGKKRINLWKDSGISSSSCGRMYKEYYLTLPGGFRLPAALCIEEYRLWDTAIDWIDEKSALQALSVFAQESLNEQMTAGRIIHKSEDLITEAGVYRFHGDYVCTEMIGRERPEEMGDIHGKNS